MSPGSAGAGSAGAGSAGTGAWRPGTHVGSVVAADASTVWVASLPGGPVLVLEGVAATIWVAATGAGDDTELVGRVADLWGQRPEHVAAEVLAFVADLEARHLLVRAVPGGV